MFAGKDCLLQYAAVSHQPATFATPTRISSNLTRRQDPQTGPFVFSKLRALLPVQKFQTPCYQPFAHSLENAKTITPAFPLTSAFFTSLFCTSSIVNPIVFNRSRALCKNTREGVGVSERYPAYFHYVAILVRRNIEKRAKPLERSRPGEPEPKGRGKAGRKIPPLRGETATQRSAWR
jgi:hypothetical protein